MIQTYQFFVFNFILTPIGFGHNKITRQPVLINLNVSKARVIEFSNLGVLLVKILNESLAFMGLLVTHDLY